MVAAKKSAKKTTAKKTTARKPAAKKAASRSTRSKSAQAADYRSFKVVPDRRFLSWQVTTQTVYWLILLICIVILQTIILVQEVNIMNILSQTAALS